MNRRYILCSLVVAVAPLVASAQFIGDTMAAAGFAETEDQAPGIAALIAGRVPPESFAPGDPSLPRPSATGSDASLPREVNPAPAHTLPREAGTYPPGLQPTGTGTPGPAMTVQQPGQPSAPAAPMPAHQPGGIVMAGSGTTYTAEETADWKAAFRPVGASVNALPAGNESVAVGGKTYAYSKGIFYQQDGNKWVVVPAPVGARLKERPAAASMISYQGSSYWYYNGAFFAWNRAEDATFVVKPPAGIVVTYLPDTAAQEMRGDQKVYVYGDNTFKPSFRGTSLVYVAL